MDQVTLHGKDLVPDLMLAGNVEVKLMEMILSLLDSNETAGFWIYLNGMAGVDNVKGERLIV
jgi:hypothetical protein